VIVDDRGDDAHAQWCKDPEFSFITDPLIMSSNLSHNTRSGMFNTVLIGICFGDVRFVEFKLPLLKFK